MADVLGNFFSSVFIIEPDGVIPHIPPVKLRRNMEELTIDEEIIKKKLYNLNVCNYMTSIHYRMT